jgi:hypothetical protein
MEINYIHTMIRLHPACVYSPQNYKHHSSFLKEKTTYWTSLSVEGGVLYLTVRKTWDLISIYMALSMYISGQDLSLLLSAFHPLSSWMINLGS